MTDATVNKEEMARLLGVSLPTFTGLIKSFPDMPIEQDGSRGVPYAFDPTRVLAWKAEKEAEARRADAKHHEFMAAFELPLDDPAAEQTQSPAQRLQTARALKVEREMAQEAGQLVYTAGVRQALVTALTVLGKRIDGLPAILGREFNLPEPVQRAMRRQLDDARALMVRDVKAALADNTGADDTGLLSAAE